MNNCLSCGEPVHHHLAIFCKEDECQKAKRKRRLKRMTEYHHETGKYKKKKHYPYMDKKIKYIPTKYICMSCGKPIFKIEEDGIMMFDRRYFCHKELCQDKYRNMTNNMEDTFLGHIAYL